MSQNNYFLGFQTSPDLKEISAMIMQKNLCHLFGKKMYPKTWSD